MQIGISVAPNNEPLIAVTLGQGGNGPSITEFIHQDMARLYAEILNRCADLQDECAKGETL